MRGQLCRFFEDLTDRLFILSYNPARITVGDRIVRNIFGYDASGADHHIIANGDAWQDYRSAADPYIISDRNRSRLRFTEFKRTVFFEDSEPVRGVGWMECRIDLYIRSDQCVISDPNDVVIQKCTVHIHFTIITEINVIAIVRKKRRRYPEVFPFPPSKLLKILSFASASAESV